MNPEQEKSPLVAGFTMTLVVTINDWSKMLEFGKLEKLPDGEAQLEIHAKGFEGLSRELNRFGTALEDLGFSCVGSISEPI
jgi:hypothetical protein